MSESLGKATLDLAVGGLPEFDSNMKTVKRGAGEAQSHLDALEAIAKLVTDTLQRIRMKADQAAETAGISDEMKHTLAGISTDAERARADVESVKMRASQAEETNVVGDAIDRKLKEVTRNANETRRAIESATGAGAVFDETAGRFRGGGGRFVPGNGGSGGGGGGGGSDGRNGVGFGPFGSGFGRIGVLGTAIGTGVLATPAVAPAALGLAAVSGVGLAGLGGTVATLALAFQGVGKAIDGDKKAFDALQPSQQQFVLLIRSLTGWLDKLKTTAAGSLFPGLTKGLQAALSPGTLGLITQAVTEFGHALGAAGEQWGKYFGSSKFQQIFGPVMKTAAASLKILAGAGLSLFDTFGVLTRAALPLTTWLTAQIAKGSKWLDTWIRAKDATGGLARAMNNARGSLTLVGKLLEAIGRAVIALGKALYPVSNTFLKALVTGFNGLATILTRNKTFIQELATTFVSGLRTSWTIASQFLTNFEVGWDKVFGKGGHLAVTLAATGLALTLELGPEAAAVVGVILAVGYIKDHWGTLQVWFSAFTAWLPHSFKGMWDALVGLTKLGVYSMLTPIQALAIAFANVTGWLGKLLAKVGLGSVVSGAQGAANAIGSLIGGLKTSGMNDLKGTAASFAPYLHAAQVNAYGGTYTGKIPFGGTYTGAHSAKIVSATPDDLTSPFGADPAFTKNLGPKAKHPKVMIPVGIGGSFKSAAFGRSLLGQALRKGVSGSMSSPSGVNLIPDALRLEIDKARGTVPKTDDIAAYTRARDALEAMTKSATTWARIPLADEIANLSSKINTLSHSVDGFDLTLAERRRHLLDDKRAHLYDKYEATPTKSVTFAPQYHVPDEATAKRKSRQEFFHFRQLMPNL